MTERLKHRRTRLGRALAIALSAAACVRASPAPGALRVLVYNMHAGKDAAGRDNLERVATLVRALDADLVLLQEVDRRTERSAGVDQIAELARLTGLHGVFGRTLPFQGGEYGIGLLSRWPPARDTLVPLPVTPPQARAGGAYEPRGVLHVVLPTPWGMLHALNTHLDASPTDDGRLQEVATLRRLADGLLQHGAIGLVGGDFNATPASPVIAHLTAGPWRDTWGECGAGVGATYPAAEPVKRIDYLFVSPTLGCDSAAVVASDASDHRPLFLMLVRSPR